MTPRDYIDEVSKDHAQISGVVQSLRAALDARDYEQARVLLLSLERIEARHYATEDALMRAVGYEEAVAHRSEHAALLETLGRINQSLALESSASVSPKIVAHLEAALGHMMDADDKLNRFVLERLVRP